jgi:hypothetical protein
MKALHKLPLHLVMQRSMLGRFSRIQRDRLNYQCLKKLTVEGCYDRENHCEVAKRKYFIICFRILRAAHAFGDQQEPRAVYDKRSYSCLS